ncbi:MAG: tetrahydrofolate dehydrogenase/cyclohydrolase catalytic domain-containing protein, partial [Planctomycetota bacterium]
MAEAHIIDGKALAAKFRRDIATRVEALKAQGRPVRLDALLVDDGDSAARQYADSQRRTCEKLGIEYRLHS